MFEKYSANRSVTVEKGFQLNRDTVSYAPYLLVKEDIIVGSIGLYGDMNKDTVLEDCKIILLRFDEDCTAAAHANSISCQLSGIGLLAPLKPEELRKAFGENLQFV